eukprot:s1_g2653.t1
MIYLFIAVLLGLAPAAVAHSKGKNFFLWWVYGAAFWIVAFPHSLLMQPNQEALESKALKADQKKCPECAELVRKEATVCRHCGYAFAEKLATPVPSDLQPVANSSAGGVSEDTRNNQSLSTTDSTVERFVLAGVTAFLVFVISVGIAVTISSMNDNRVPRPVAMSPDTLPTPLAPPRNSSNAADGSTLTGPRPTNAKLISGVECREVSYHGFVRFLVCEEDAGAADWRRAGMNACKGRSVCNVWIWDRIEKAGTSLPMTEAETNSAVAVWIHSQRELIECRTDGC